MKMWITKLLDKKGGEIDWYKKPLKGPANNILKVFIIDTSVLKIYYGDIKCNSASFVLVIFFNFDIEKNWNFGIF